MICILLAQTSHTNKVRIPFWVWEVLVINLVTLDLYLRMQMDSKDSMLIDIMVNCFTSNLVAINM